MKKCIFSSLVFLGLCGSSFSFAQNSPTLIPLASGDEVKNAYQKLKANKGDFISGYNQVAKESNLQTKMATGIMDRATITQFLAYLVKTLMQIAMVIGAVMIIYAGYIYAGGVFSGNVTKAPSAIKSAIIGILVIVFSYLIIKILTSMFLE